MVKEMYKELNALGLMDIVGGIQYRNAMVKNLSVIGDRIEHGLQAIFDEYRDQYGGNHFVLIAKTENCGYEYIQFSDGKVNIGRELVICSW